MQWDQIVEIIRRIIDDIRRECIIQNTAIRDDIFGILEKKCTVVYYPLPEEKNCGFHIKKIVGDRLEDFVYINTDKPMANQIFVAAHELGHIYMVAEKVRQEIGYKREFTEKEEEDITDRFAAELLMPLNEFGKMFRVHMKELDICFGKVRMDDLIRVIVLQMNDFMVPCEAVLRRLEETGFVSPETEKELLDKIDTINRFAEILIKDLNSYLSEKTGIKTIPGIRDLVEKAENNENVDSFLVNRVKRDFDLTDVPEIGEDFEVHIGEN